MNDKRQLTVQDVLAFKNVSDAQVSPDGDQIAFVVGDSFTDGTKLAKSDIWLVPSSGGQPIQMTRGPRSNTTPRWSPDGSSIAFLSDRIVDGQRQIYKISPTGGEAIQLTNIEGSIPTPRGLNPLTWTPDGTKLLFLKLDGQNEQEKATERDRQDVILFEDAPKYTRLHSVDIDSQELECVSPDRLQIWEFTIASSGRDIAAVASDLPFEQHWYSNRLVRFELGATESHTLHQSRRQIAKPEWSPDASSVAFLSSMWSDRGVVAGGVFVVPAKGGEAKQLCEDVKASTSWLRWLDAPNRLLTVAQECGSTAIAEINPTNNTRNVLWSAPATMSEPNWSQFSASFDRIAFVLESDTSPRNLWSASLAGPLNPVQITYFNDRASLFDIGRVEEISWKGADGWDMQGLLIHPVGASDGPHPMVTVVHGGPTSSHTRQFYAARGWNQVLASAGFVVFLPNPRGSTGQGLEFTEAVVGDMGGKDWTDITNGIDYLIEKGIADPDKLGIGGWSYGGFMTAWAVTQTNRFKAGVMGAGIADWRSFHGKSYLCDWDTIFLGDADPYDPDGPYRERSPITFLKNAETPTLILHGEQDEDVPVEQSHMFYRALRDRGIETELAIYPREAHGPVEKNHLIDVATRITDWFSRYLKA